MCDSWLAEQQPSPEVLHNFSMMPQAQRKRIVLGCMDRPPQNLDAWLAGCIRNWRTTEMERRLTAAPTPQPRQDVAFRSAATKAGSSEAAPAPVRPSLPAPTVSAPVPDVCLKLASHWPGGKSSMIATLMEVLDDDTMEALMALEPWDQAAIAFAFMVTAPPDSAAWSSFASNLVKRLLRLRGDQTPESSPATRVPKNGTATINVHFVLGGFSSVTAGTLMTVMQKMIPRMHQQLTWMFTPVIFLREGTMDNIPTDVIHKHTEVIFDMECWGCEQLADKFEERLETWRTNGTKFVFLANVGFTEQPDVKLSDVTKNYLHEKGNKWLWTFLQASEATRLQFKDEDVADVLLGPPTAALTQELEDMWGERTELIQPAEQQVSPLLPHVHSTPAKFGVTPVLHRSSVTSRPRT